MDVKFTDPDLREPFYNEYIKREWSSDQTDDWDRIDFYVLPPYNNSNINDYQFLIDLEG